jgi:hypothetical protein
MTLSAIVFPLEGDAVAVERDQPAIGDGYAMGVALQIGQHRFRPAERALAVDDPFAGAQRRQVFGEGSRVVEMRVVAEEAQEAAPVGCRELLQEQPAEDARKHAHRQKEARPTRHPPGATKKHSAHSLYFIGQPVLRGYSPNPVCR